MTNGKSLVEHLERRTLLSVVPGGFDQATLVSGLDRPTAMEFAPDGRLFVAEQGGTLRVVKDGQLLPTPFVSLPADSSGERGLLGIAFDPQFTSNHFVYVYWTAQSPVTHNRISRFTASGDVAVAGSEVDILDLPALSAATNHNGGAIHFGADGKLYVGVGENANAPNAQSLDTTLGKLLRINPDGSAPSDNPFVSQTSGINRDIWAMGLRNPFTFAVQPGTGRIFINDVGQNTFEEIDAGAAGANYGWPTTEGFAQAGQQPPVGYRDPIYSYVHSAANGDAIVGGTFYATRAGGTAFPASYSGAYFFSDNGGGYIKVVNASTLNDGTVPASAVSTFATGLVSPVDLKEGPDGSIYALTRGASDAQGQVQRFSATAPAPTPTPTPTPAPTPTPVGAGTGPDLIGQISALPTAPIIAGSRGKVTVRLQNVGNVNASGTISVNLLLSQDPSADATDASLATVSKTVTIKPNGAKKLAFKFNYPQSASGNYYVLAELDTSNAVAESNESNNLAQSNTLVSVTPAVVDFSLTIAKSPTVVEMGKVSSATVKLLNAGTVAYAGPLDVALYAATDSTGSAGAVTLTTVTANVRLKPNAPKKLKVKFSLPPGFAPGTYFLSSAVDPLAKIAESEEANNFAVAATSFQAT